jgi:sugar phosphate isomerase/epimerase
LNKSKDSGCIRTPNIKPRPVVAPRPATTGRGFIGETMRFTRRDLLKLGVGAMLTAGVRPARLLAGPSKKIPIALELYSLRDIAGKDVPGTLAAVARMGYEGVEWVGWDNYYGRKAPDLRKMIDQTGLKSAGSHLNLDALTGDALKRTIEFNKILGNKFLIVSSLPRNNMNSVAALIDAAKLLTDLAEQVKDAGMRVGYHCHSLDFKPVADRIPWEVIFANAGPSVVMQLDTGNCLEGGADPVAILKKFPHRATTVHLKEFGGPKDAVVGEGDVPWKEVFAVCETTGDTEWYIVEQEAFRNSSLESAELCLKNLRKMGK